MQRAYILFVTIIIIAIASLTGVYQFNASSGHIQAISSIKAADTGHNRIGSSGGINCWTTPFAISLNGVNGFQAVKRWSNASGSDPGVLEFVLRPGSTGYLNLTYRLYAPQYDTPHTIEGQIKLLYTGPNRSAWEMFNMPLFTKHVWGFNGSSRFTFLDAQRVGIGIGASSVTPTGLYSVDVMYTISASASAVMGTYILLLPGMGCPGQLITIGDTPYSGPSPWGEIN